MSARFLPTIVCEKSSIPAAKRIYAALDYIDSSGSLVKIQKKKKTKKGLKERSQSLSPEKVLKHRVTRTKEYADGLKTRKERNKRARAKNEEMQKEQKRLKETGMKEKIRLNQLFAVYAEQNEASYRQSAQVVRPMFPNLLKQPSSIQKQKSNYKTETELPNLSSSKLQESSNHKQEKRPAL